jgi:hypothetical protein
MISYPFRRVNSTFKFPACVRLCSSLLYRISSASFTASSPPPIGSNQILGNYFECLSQSYLHSAIKNLELHHRGGAYDRGIDLEGLWRISNSKQIRVLAQCKYSPNKPLAAIHLRALEGTLNQYCSAEDGSNAPVLGMLIGCELDYSSESQVYWRKSRLPLILCSLNIPKGLFHPASTPQNINRISLTRFSLNSAAQDLLNDNLIIALARNTETGIPSLSIKIKE